MKSRKRLIGIFVILALSTIFINTIRKAPQNMPLQSFRIACLLATHAQKQDADKYLIPYAHITHTTYMDAKNKTPLQCYLRFAHRDIACVPPAVGTRQNIQKCPQFSSIAGTHKICYILNSKLNPLVELLKKKPAVALGRYSTFKNNIVETWQQARDILSGTTP